MARVICGISNIPIKISYVPMLLKNRELNHPIFTLKQKDLLNLYIKYTKGELSDIDSYLLFLALLYSTDAVKFVAPARITSSTSRIIASQIGQLVNVIWQTDAIKHPRFKQPKYKLTKDNDTLDNVKIWIQAWQSNINDFKLGLSRDSDIRKLAKVEEKLYKVIHSPDASNQLLASVIADWADKAADFPADKADNWKLIIRKCFNPSAMFSTPKAKILEIKHYCEENLEIGTVHRIKLMEVLKHGIALHNDFLGIGVFDNPKDAELGYTLLDNTEDTKVAKQKEEDILLKIAAEAPDKFPIESNYPNKLAYIRAKVAYQQAQKLKAKDTNNPLLGTL